MSNAILDFDLQCDDLKYGNQILNVFKTGRNAIIMRGKIKIFMKLQIF